MLHCDYYCIVLNGNFPLFRSIIVMDQIPKETDGKSLTSKNFEQKQLRSSDNRIVSGSAISDSKQLRPNPKQSRKALELKVSHNYILNDRDIKVIIRERLMNIFYMSKHRSVDTTVYIHFQLMI